MKFDRIFVKNIINSNRTKILILLMIILNFLYVPMFLEENTFFENWFYVDNIIYYTIFLLIFILFSTVNIINNFDYCEFVIIRYKTKKEYLNKLIKNVLVINFILILVNYMLLFIILTFKSDGFIIENLLYNIPNYIYVIWLSIRKIITIELISLVFLFVAKLIDKPYNIFINLSLILLILLPGYKDKMVMSLSDMFIFYGDYFIYHRYNSFLLEIIIFCRYHIIYILLLILMYKFTLRKLKNITN